MNEEVKKEILKIAEQLYGFSVLALRVPWMHKRRIRFLAGKLEDIVERYNGTI